MKARCRLCHRCLSSMVPLPGSSQALPSFSLPSRGGLISGAQGETPWCDVLWLTLQAVLAAWASPEVSLDLQPGPG